MIITFYGVRGSAPTPGPTTIKYGGNTSCVHLALDNGQDVILDAGTGMHKLGKVLFNKTAPINIILSHVHWDHIQGYPFFEPIFQADRQIDVFTSVDSNDQAPGTLEDYLGDKFASRTHSRWAARHKEKFDRRAKWYAKKEVYNAGAR